MKMWRDVMGPHHTVNAKDEVMGPLEKSTVQEKARVFLNPKGSQKRDPGNHLRMGLVLVKFLVNDQTKRIPS